MIAEQDLLEAIEACQKEKNPTSHTCIKLASYLTIYDRLYSVKQGGYSRDSGTEFARYARMLTPDDLLSTFDDLMAVLIAVNPKLYDATMAKIKGRGNASPP